MLPKPYATLADALYAERSKAHPQMLAESFRVSGIKQTAHNSTTGLQVLQNMDRIFAGADAHRAYRDDLERKVMEKA